MAEEKDIYIKLMEDIIGESINIDPTASIFDEKINEKIIENCDKLAKALGISENKTDEKIDVGINGNRFLEPCPAAYTGKLKDENGDLKKIFDTVFIGLNPYSEGARDDFPDDMTWGDLANIHHPNDIWYEEVDERYNNDRYKIPAVITDKKFPRNNYWRVFGNKEGSKDVSPYYRMIFSIHVALHRDRIEKEFQLKPFTKWGEFTNFYERKEDVTDAILQILEKFPIANFEAIPYKSGKFRVTEFENLLNEENNDALALKYRAYFLDMMEFINKHAADDAYIIATASIVDENEEGKKKVMLDALYNALKHYKKSSDGNKDDHFFVYNRKTKQC